STFASCPVETSSRTKTSQPLASKSSERCEPMNPAPPVISALPPTAQAYSAVFEAAERLLDRGGARLEPERRPQLPEALAPAVRAHVRLGQLEPDLDRAGLLPGGLLQGRDRLGRHARDGGLHEVGLHGERVEPAGPAQVRGGRSRAFERVSREARREPRRRE